MAGLTLVVMAGGLGSRYGGLKQIDPVGPSGETILEYSVYDARRAGFTEVVIVLAPGLVEPFRAGVGQRLERGGPVRYASQELGPLPAGFQVPAGRRKPWGTAHAVLAAKNLIDAPFAIITADDYYGPTAFGAMARWLSRSKPPEGPSYADGFDKLNHLCMVGYRVEQTLTDHGAVARGVCEVGDDGFLRWITERTRIEPTPGGARYLGDDGQTWARLSAGTLVSMSLWGFTPGFLTLVEQGFPDFLAAGLAVDPLGCEYLLPTVVEAALQAGQADVIVLPTSERWYGVTYQADKPGVVQALAAKHATGQYPTPLWGD